MNIADDIKFEDWFMSRFNTHPGECSHSQKTIDIRNAWDAACEHKNKEIDKYKTLFEEEHYFRVEEFNKYKKLKECLEFVIKESGTSANYNKKCREVLKELER